MSEGSISIRIEHARPLAQRDPDLPGERGRTRDLRRSQESFGAHPGRRLLGTRALANLKSHLFRQKSLTSKRFGLRV